MNKNALDSAVLLAIYDRYDAWAATGRRRPEPSLTPAVVRDLVIDGQGGPVSRQLGLLGRKRAYSLIAGSLRRLHRAGIIARSTGLSTDTGREAWCYEPRGAYEPRDS